jgi:hypothetical protein
MEQVGMGFEMGGASVGLGFKMGGASRKSETHSKWSKSKWKRELETEHAARSLLLRMPFPLRPDLLGRRSKSKWENLAIAESSK